MDHQQLTPPAKLSNGLSARTTKRGQGGFSLIEALVVLTIMAFAASIIVANGPPGTPTLVKETDRLAVRLNDARDLALIQNRPVLIELTTSGYELKIRSRSEWVPPEDRREFSPWEDGTTLNIANTRLPAAIIYDTTGLTEPHSLSLLREGRIESLSIDGAGNISRKSGGV